MYIICYELNGENTWEMVSGEDAMQIRVNELMEELDCEAEDIMVFDKETELSMENNVVNNLIAAMADYTNECGAWSDWEFIDTLVSCGITKQDLIDYGIGDSDMVKEYFDESE